MYTLCIRKFKFHYNDFFPNMSVSQACNKLYNDKVYQYNSINSNFLELYWDDGAFCVKINGGSTAQFLADNWK